MPERPRFDSPKKFEPSKKHAPRQATGRSESGARNASEPKPRTWSGKSGAPARKAEHSAASSKAAAPKRSGRYSSGPYQPPRSAQTTQVTKAVDSNGTFRMVAKTFFGLEEVLAKELVALGAQNVQSYRRTVQFSGDMTLLYKCNIWLRTAIRVLMPIHTFTATNEQELYNGIRSIRWNDWLQVDDTFSVDGTVRSETFTHSKYVALKSKDAIVDQFRDMLGRRPSVDVENPHVRIDIYIHDTQVIVSIDSSGDSLHRRGWRQEQGQAPLNEILAAGMVLLAGYDGSAPLLDPFCGSGTILAEAALIGLNRAPGLFGREYGFMKWKSFNRTTYNRCVNEARLAERLLAMPITGSDINLDVVTAARRNMEHAGLDKYITISCLPFDNQKTHAPSGTIITNPPYGERMELEDAKGFFRTLGGNLKHNFIGWDAWVIAAKGEAISYIGLKAAKRHDLFNGDIDCKYQKFEMYSGRK